jgi:Zn-dependent protease
MKNRGFPFLRLGGVDIVIDYSWPVIFLIILVIAQGSLASTYPEYSTFIHWLVAGIISVLIFLSVLIHELAHTFTAKKLGAHVRTIQLNIFGGQTHGTPVSRSGRHEFIIALSGWAASVLLGCLCLTVYGYFWFLQIGHPVRGIAAYLMVANFILAGLHMIPGFPLDGGSALRAILWDRWNDVARATRVVSQLGNGLALFFLIFGILQFIATQSLLSGFLFILGLFMKLSAIGNYRNVLEYSALENVRIRQVMHENVIAVDWLISVEELVQDFVYKHRLTYFPVLNREETVGMVSLNAVKTVAKDLWTFKQVRDIMIPIESVVCTTPESDASEVLKKMESQNVECVPVMENGRLFGVVTRNDILRLYRIKSDLRIS